MRPKLKWLSDELVEQIVAEARDILTTLGVEIHNDGVVDMLSDKGAKVEGGRVYLTNDLIDAALASAPGSITMHDVEGNVSHELADDLVSFTPGSAAINILDGATGTVRKPTTEDYVRYVKLVSGLANIASQSTAMIAADVPEMISDSYRLFLGLLYCSKPVVTGAFTIEAFDIMKDLLVAVRGSGEELAAKPLAIFSCCPTSPIKWSDVTSQNVVDCAKWSIPVEFISMPLSGFMAPVTLVGSLIQHTAETLSGLVISQHTKPGAPVLWGGSPAIFDMRYETTPMGAIETMMFVSSYCQIGKSLGVPTQGYISLSDAKLLDAQAGLESGIGAVLAALSGINSISGPGMLDFESCFSLEKLVVDNEICGMAFRLIAGIEPREDFPALPLMEELLRDQHLLIADHTRRHLRAEIAFPGPVIDRANRARWQDEGALTLGQRARREIERLVDGYSPSPLADDKKGELVRLMQAEARRYGMDHLPSRQE
jgi:trimethylamine--corrinoid protein Co-methyltransferase